MKIVIAGAGIGGLYIAGLLSETFDVVLYEKSKSLDEMRYDWHDDVSPTVFNKLNLPIPEGSFPKKNWTFFAPYEKSKIKLDQRADLIDFSIERRPLNNMLFERRGKAIIYFDACVTKALCNDNGVVGCEVVISGKKETISCDLLIDCCGVNSAVRRSLPPSLNIQNEVDKNDVFRAFRAFFKANPDVKIPTDINKVYMKHLGRKGISWCIIDNAPNTINVLVGKIGELTAPELTESLSDLRKYNPILGDEILRGGQICTIPVRYPLSLLVADGYVLLGDSACMTAPMIGSGIATTLTSAKFLADILIKAPDFSAKNLWEYQYKVFKAFGAEHCGVDIMKRWMLNVDNDDIAWIFSSGILSNSDLQSASIGKMLKLTMKDYLYKFKKGIKKLPLLLGMAGVLNTSNKVNKIAKSIPETYNTERITAWRNRLDKSFEV